MKKTMLWMPRRLFLTNNEITILERDFENLRYSSTDGSPCPSSHTVTVETCHNTQQQIADLADLASHLLPITGTSTM